MKKLLFIFLVIAMLSPIVSAYSATYYLTTDADDGYTQQMTTNATWSDIRNGAGTDVDTTSVQLLTDIKADSATDRFAYLHRSHLIFNTSDLPDSDIWINSATIRLTTSSASTVLGDMGVGITNFTIDGTITGDDYDNCGILLQSDYKNVSAVGVGTTNTWTLTSAGRANVSKTGLTGFCIRMEPDISNSSPWLLNSRTYFGVWSAAHVTASEIPLLTVDYTLKPTSAFSGTPTSGLNPLSVTFTDSSTNYPTNWDWYWSADETKDSDDQNPTTTLPTGTYNVRLYTANTAGGDWENKTAYIYSTPAPTDIYISSVSSVTNKGATFGIGGCFNGSVWVKYGQNPQGMTWKSQNATCSGSAATITVSGGNMLTNTLYYVHACQLGVCNTSYSTFTTSAPGAVTQPNLGSGFDNLTESEFNLFNVVPDIMTPYTTVIPLNIFFGIILGLITMGMWAANKSTRLVSVLMIIAAPLLFSAGSGLDIGIPGALQSLGEACLAVGIAGTLLSLVRR
jgi:PKD repeat protein